MDEVGQDVGVGVAQRQPEPPAIAEFDCHRPPDVNRVAARGDGEHARQRRDVLPAKGSSHAAVMQPHPVGMQEDAAAALAIRCPNM